MRLFPVSYLENRACVAGFLLSSGRLSSLANLLNLMQRIEEILAHPNILVRHDLDNPLPLAADDDVLLHREHVAHVTDFIELVVARSAQVIAREEHFPDQLIWTQEQNQVQKQRFVVLIQREVATVVLQAVDVGVVQLQLRRDAL